MRLLPLLLTCAAAAQPCAKCGVKREDGQMPDWNCCWSGGSWHGKCTDSGTYTWHEGDVALAGLAVNCPDGKGRKVPHVMSMAMVLDERALRIADDHGIFECASSYDDAVEREGRLSKLVLDANLNLGTMQHNYHSRDWRQVLPTVENAALVPNGANFPSCPGIDLDIFYKEGWHAAGATPHPVEFLFYKTNRGVGADAVAARSSQRTSTKRVLLASHNFDGDGAPRYLLHAAEVLKRDHDLLAWSFDAPEQHGPSSPQHWAGPKINGQRAPMNRTVAFYELLGCLRCVAGSRHFAIVQCSSSAADGKSLAAKCPCPSVSRRKVVAMSPATVGARRHGSENTENPCPTAKSAERSRKHCLRAAARTPGRFRTVVACTSSLRAIKKYGGSTRGCKPQHHSRAHWKP